MIFFLECCYLKIGEFFHDQLLSLYQGGLSFVLLDFEMEAKAINNLVDGEKLRVSPARKGLV